MSQTWWQHYFLCRWFFIRRVLGEWQPEWMDRYFQKACVLISLERFEEALSDLKKAQGGLRQTAILPVVSIMLKYIVDLCWFALMFGQGFPVFLCFYYDWQYMTVHLYILLFLYKCLQNTTCCSFIFIIHWPRPWSAWLRRWCKTRNNSSSLRWSNLPTGFLHCSRRTCR